MKPQRIQRKRTPSYNMQEESKKLNDLPAKSVCRPGKWGNPFPVGKEGPFKRFAIDNEGAVGFFEDMLTDKEFLQATNYPLQDIEELKGYNLACFCPLDQPCHADVLLEIANS